MKDTLRFASICGSHLNMANRCLHYGVHEGLGEIPAEWRAAVADGSTWLVIKRIVNAEFPPLITAICEAGNAMQSIAKQEDEWQLLQKIKAIVQNKKTLGETVTWPDVAESVLKSRPKCGASGPSIFAFILRYGDYRLEQVEAYVRIFGQTSRELWDKVWAALSFELKGFKDHLRWRHMLVKFGYCFPERPISSSDATCMDATKI